MVNCSGDTYCQMLLSDGERCLLRDGGDEECPIWKEHRMQEIRDMEKDAARVERRDARARPLDTTTLTVPDPALNPPNPKQRYGDLKPNMALVPGVAVAHEALAMEQGAAKYGAYNWREKAVEALTYISAAKRRGRPGLLRRTRAVVHQDTRAAGPVQADAGG